MGRVDLSRSEVVERRLRMANSSPDVKALFNSPAYIYNLDDDDNEHYIPGPTMDYWSRTPSGNGGAPLPPIVRPSLLNIIFRQTHVI